MKMNILDLEMNQPSGSIIEIGAVSYDVKTRNVQSKFQSFVKLPDGETLAPEITTLTNIGSHFLDSAPTLAEALEAYWKWAIECGCHKYIAAWGNDYWDVIEASKSLGVSYPSRMSTLNIKVMASIMRCEYPNKKAKGGLKNSLDVFGIDFVGTQHRALDDASQTSRVVDFLSEKFRLGLDVTKLVGNTSD